MNKLIGILFIAISAAAFGTLAIFGRYAYNATRAHSRKTDRRPPADKGRIESPKNQSIQGIISIQLI